ncbi:hypothetical protein ACFVAJ_19280 [Agromyces sp. NPDC057679]|uniref:hypothetical protein n=1 Tax=Agromyces sp. NPDC057679 TaxID=3346207 RepID=UPI00366B9C60
MSNTAVDILARPTSLAGLKNAYEQWTYLYAMIRRELSKQLGGFFRVDVGGDLTGVCEQPPPESPLTSVDEAVDQVTMFLAPHAGMTAVRLRGLVSYFAERGDRNLSHLHSAAAKDPDLLELGYCRREILAAANAVLGARPRHWESSLLAEVIRDRDWTPEVSASHRASIEKFRRRMSGHSSCGHASAQAA